METKFSGLEWEKWIAVSFPILASLLITFIDYILFDVFHVIIKNETHELISLLVYSFSVLFGINSLKDFSKLNKIKNDGA